MLGSVTLLCPSSSQNILTLRESLSCGPQTWAVFNMAWQLHHWRTVPNFTGGKTERPGNLPGGTQLVRGRVYENASSRPTSWLWASLCPSWHWNSSCSVSGPSLCPCPPDNSRGSDPECAHSSLPLVLHLSNPVSYLKCWRFIHHGFLAFVLIFFNILHWNAVHLGSCFFVLFCFFWLPQFVSVTGCSGNWSGLLTSLNTVIVQ